MSYRRAARLAHGVLGQVIGGALRLTLDRLLLRDGHHLVGLGVDVLAPLGHEGHTALVAGQVMSLMGLQSVRPQLVLAVEPLAAQVTRVDGIRLGVAPHVADEVVASVGLVGAHQTLEGHFVLILLLLLGLLLAAAAARH